LVNIIVIINIDVDRRLYFGLAGVFSVFANYLRVNTGRRG
jgi:hypothetical protein